MKKNGILWGIIALLGLTVAFLTGFLVSEKSKPQSTVASVSQSEYVGETAAKAIAIAHAGFSESQISLLRAKLESDGNSALYAVEFTENFDTYHYKINAINGAVLSYDCDADSAEVSPSPSSSSSLKNASQSKSIDEDTAKSTAFSHANVAAEDASFIQIALNHNDGHAQYEIHFRKEFIAYYYKIDGITGKILHNEIVNNELKK